MLQSFLISVEKNCQWKLFSSVVSFFPEIGYEAVFISTKSLVACKTYMWVGTAVRYHTANGLKSRIGRKYLYIVTYSLALSHFSIVKKEGFLINIIVV